MSSLKADFDELRERIRHGRELGHASFEPIYYLVFPPDQILEMKRQTPAWVSKLHQEGWEVHIFSIAEHIWSLLKQDPLWSLCVMEDKSAPLDWRRTNKALSSRREGRRHPRSVHQAPASDTELCALLRDHSEDRYCKENRPDHRLRRQNATR